MRWISIFCWICQIFHLSNYVSSMYANFFFFFYCVCDSNCWRLVRALVMWTLDLRKMRWDVTLWNLSVPRLIRLQKVKLRRNAPFVRLLSLWESSFWLSGLSTFMNVSRLWYLIHIACNVQEEFEAGEEMGRLSCKHEHHFQCLKQWLAKKNSCPMCKQEVVSRHRHHLAKSWFSFFGFQYFLGYWTLASPVCISSISYRLLEFDSSLFFVVIFYFSLCLENSLFPKLSLSCVVVIDSVFFFLLSLVLLWSLTIGRVLYFYSLNLCLLFWVGPYQVVINTYRFFLVKRYTNSWIMYKVVKV